MYRKIVPILFLLVSCSVFSQEKDEVTTYFNQYLSPKSQFELIQNSLPTLEECEQVFIGDNAKVYFDEIQKVRDEIKSMLSKLATINAVESTYEKFTSDEAKNDQQTYGMYKIKDVLKPGITYYVVSYVEKGGDTSRYSPYKFFVKINEKWVFFPKPTRVFNK